MKTFKTFRAMNEAVKDAADKGEYDYEGDMAKSSLRTIIRNAQMMHDMLGEDTNLPEWVQGKITLAEDYIVAAAQYMQSEMNEEAELEEAKTGPKKAKPSRAGNYDTPSSPDYLGDKKRTRSAPNPIPRYPGSTSKKAFLMSGSRSSPPTSSTAEKAKNEEVELDEISKELAWKAANKSLEKTRVAAYGSIYGGESGHKRFLKAVRQQKKITDYASAKTPKVPYVKEEEQMDEYNATPYRSTERGARGSKRAGLPRATNARQFFRPPEGFTKKGIEKGGGVKTVYHYKGKSSAPVGATMKMGGVKVNLGKTPTKRRPQEGSK